jgi:hypothetical protein
MMKHKLVRIAIGVLEALIALSAIGAGYRPVPPFRLSP